MFSILSTLTFCTTQDCCTHYLRLLHTNRKASASLLGIMISVWLPVIALSIHHNFPPFFTYMPLFFFIFCEKLLSLCRSICSCCSGYVHLYRMCVESISDYTCICTALSLSFDIHAAQTHCSLQSM